jgi:hypothetical protein
MHAAKNPALQRHHNAAICARVTGSFDRSCHRRSRP